MSGNRVLLTTLSVRTSAKGNQYLAGWLGKASVVAFAGEPDKFGNPTWDVFLCEPEPRLAAQKAPQGPQERDEAPARVSAPSNAQTRPGGSERAYRPGSAAARRDRAERDAIARHGGDGALEDEKIPFG
jgi:hypothetical protein